MALHGLEDSVPRVLAGIVNRTLRRGRIPKVSCMSAVRNTVKKHWGDLERAAIAVADPTMDFQTRLHQTMAPYGWGKYMGTHIIRGYDVIEGIPFVMEWTDFIAMSDGEQEVYNLLGKDITGADPGSFARKLSNDINEGVEDAKKRVLSVGDVQVGFCELLQAKLHKRPEPLPEKLTPEIVDAIRRRLTGNLETDKIVFAPAAYLLFALE